MLKVNFINNALYYDEKINVTMSMCKAYFETAKMTTQDL